jgi:hypothetical protein
MIPQMMARHWILGLMLASIAWAWTGCMNGARSDPVVFTSLPPAPLVVPYSPKAHQTSVILKMGLHDMETNRPEIAVAMAKTRELETELGELQNKVYAGQPALWTYEHYSGVVDQWYNQLPTQRAALTKYENSGGTDETRRRQKACNDLHQLLIPVLLDELAANAAFGPFTRDTIESMLTVFTNGLPASYWIPDNLVRYYTGASIPGGRDGMVQSYEQWRSELNRCRPALAVATGKIVRDYAVPPEVLADIKSYVAEQTITGMAGECYVPVRTPKELVDLRRVLDEQTGKLARLRDALRKNKP